MTDPRILTWLSDQFGEIKGMLGELRALTFTDRQTTIEVHRHLTGRMDHLTERMDALKDSRNGRYGWMRHVPWVKVTALIIVGLLLATGHMTVPEFKTWVAEKVKSL